MINKSRFSYYNVRKLALISFVFFISQTPGICMAVQKEATASSQAEMSAPGATEQTESNANKKSIEFRQIESTDRLSANSTKQSPNRRYGMRATDVAPREEKRSKEKIFRVAISEDSCRDPAPKKQRARKRMANDNPKCCCCCKKFMEYVQADREMIGRSSSYENGPDLKIFKHSPKKELIPYDEAEPNARENLWNCMADEEEDDDLIDEKKLGTQLWLLSPENGNTLSQNIEKWCQESGWMLQWNAKCDYPVQAETLFKGTFSEAIEYLIDGYKEADSPLRVDSYPKQRLIVVSVF